MNTTRPDRTPATPGTCAAGDPTNLLSPVDAAGPAPQATAVTGGLWLTAQQSVTVQRRRYVTGSSAHPAKMLPAIAARAISTYSHPGDLVLDPMCGIGTTLVEAAHLARPAIGVEYEPRWAALARANLAHADLELARAASDHEQLEHQNHQHSDAVLERHEHGDTGEDPLVPSPRTPGWVLEGDARRLGWLLPDELRGHVELVLTSPPYGPSTHGHLANRRGGAIRKINHHYGDTLDRGNLANIGHHRLLAGFTRILRAAAEFLRPGGHVVITARPWREHGELIDLPSQVFACGTAAGLVPVARHVALLGRVTDHGALVSRGSFFQRDHVAKQRAAGLPLHLITHEDVLVLRRPTTRPATTTGGRP